MKVAIIDYGAGNIFSVQSALRRLGVEPILTADKSLLASADKIILPGVGEAAYAMEQLRKRELVDFIPTQKQPLMGICLGMQLLCNHTDEGNVDCLGIIPTNVKRFPSDAGVKIPHVGWNTINRATSPIMEGVADGSYVYFVHSYYAESCEWSIAECDYALPFAAALRKDNFYGCQFHPEKSAEIGAKILENFLNL